MFVIVSMINKSLAQTQLRYTFFEAVEVAIEIVGNWQIAYNVKYNDVEIRECLTNAQEYHFTDHVSVHEYSVYIGQPE